MSTLASTAMINSIAHVQRNYRIAAAAVIIATRPNQLALPKMKDVLERSKAGGILLEAIRYLDPKRLMSDEHVQDTLERALREAREIFAKTTAKYERLSDDERTQSIFAVACIAKELIIEWQQPLP